MGMKRKLTESPQFSEAFKDLSRLLGQVHLIENRLIAKASRMQNLISSLENLENLRPDCLLAKKVERSLLKGRRSDRTPPGRTNPASNRESPRQSAPTHIALDRDKAGVCFPTYKTVPHTSTDHTRRNHHDINRFRWLDQTKGQVIAGSNN